MMFCGLSLSKAITSNGGLLRRAHERSMRASALSKRRRVKERREPSRTNSTLVKMMIRDCRHHRERAVANSFFAMTMMKTQTQRRRQCRSARSNSDTFECRIARAPTGDSGNVCARDSRRRRSSAGQAEPRVRRVHRTHVDELCNIDWSGMVTTRALMPIAMTARCWCATGRIGRRGVGRSSSTSHCAPSKWRCVQRTTREMGVGSHVVEI